MWNILFKTLCNPDMFRTLAYSQRWYILELKHIQNSAEYLRWNILLRTLWNYSDYFMYQLFFRTINLILLLYPLLIIKSTTYSYTFLQPLLSIWALGLLITHSIVEIWQNFGYGFRVRRKENIYPFGNVITLQIILRKKF